MEIGTKIDYLTFVRKTASSKGRHKRGVFRCSCGKEIIRIIREMKIKSINLRHCGCMPKEIRPEKVEVRNRKGMDTVKDGFDQEIAKKFLSMRL